MDSIKKLLAFLIIILASLVLLSCGGTPSSQPGDQAAGNTQITIAIPNKGAAFTPLFVAKNQGIFEKYGLDAEIAQVKSDAAVAGLQSGDVDFMAGIGSATRGALRGLEIKVVIVMASSPNHELVAVGDITSFDQLRGEIIAGAPPGNTVNVITEEILEQNGLQPDEYELINAGPSGSDRVASLTSGTASATAIEPTDAIRLKEEGYNVLARISEFIELPFTGLAVSQSMIDDEPDIIKRTLEATLEATEITANQKDKVIPVIAQEFDVTDEQAEEIYESMKDTWALDGKPTPAAVDFEFEVDKEEMELDEIKPEQVYDFSLLEEVTSP